MPLFDKQGRTINYLRIAVTDRCNLRCFYCMPEEGIEYVDRKDLMTYEEMLRVVKVFAGQGITKIRITGGEPFIRKDMMEFIRTISRIDQLEIHLTTNGTLTSQLIPELAQIGLKSVNLSLDAIDPVRFKEITRRDVFEKVMETFHKLIEYHIPVKINAVVMEGKNIDQLIPLTELAKENPVGVRFIEEMPFNGSGAKGTGLNWNHIKILEHLKATYPNIEKLPDPQYSTSYNYRIPGYKGTVGIIAAYSRTFCGSCNRVRITPKGLLKTCLYDSGVFNINKLMRSGATDQEVLDTLQEALNHRSKDGFEAEAKRTFWLPVKESMSTIGG